MVFKISCKGVTRTVTCDQLDKAPECLFTKVLRADRAWASGDKTLVLPADGRSPGAWHGNESLFKVRSRAQVIGLAGSKGVSGREGERQQKREFGPFSSV